MIIIERMLETSLGIAEIAKEIYKLVSDDVINPTDPDLQIFYHHARKVSEALVNLAEKIAEKQGGPA